MKVTVIISSFFLLFLLSHQQEGKTTDKISHINDTLNVGYTYWWPYSGPFLFNCNPKQDYAFIFTGTVKRIDPYAVDTTILYDAQYGVIEIKKVIYAAHCKRQPYQKQRYFKTDCFYKLGIKEGDHVLVTCYLYENGYAIPGGKSILKIKKTKGKAHKSMYTLIHRPEKVNYKDSLFWAQYQLKEAFLNAASCELAKKSRKNN